ncbi:hypothetical protein XA68_15264 [Ophiocordyceps unilateralis]|uniref:ATP synthase subunit epsilon, mitochondrial n=1 Tax=Ophiocordyceps unilateralis TaxID=268505 RepID=A0A2A9PML4_OPHUN|nr:hypothetical protein XA68_15264 [Ophiocordyceps unilateralis]
MNIPSHPPPKYESIFGPAAHPTRPAAAAAHPTRPSHAATIFQRTHAFQVDTTARDPPPPRLSEFVPFCSTKDRFGSCQPLRMRHAGAVDDLEVRGCGCHARMHTERGGALQWRYAGRAERKVAGASGLLVLDLITTGVGAGEERRRPVAYLMRSSQLRSNGTGAPAAGNDWRLLIDLRGWLATKKEAQQMEVLITASCLALLKKEVDRRHRRRVFYVLPCPSLFIAAKSLQWCHVTTGSFIFPPAPAKGEGRQIPPSDQHRLFTYLLVVHNRFAVAKMTAAWRAAGLTYNHYLAVAARTVRRCLKEDKRIAAERHGESDLRFAKWQKGVSGEVKDLQRANAAAMAENAS